MVELLIIILLVIAAAFFISAIKTIASTIFDAMINQIQEESEHEKWEIKGPKQIK